MSEAARDRAFAACLAEVAGVRVDDVPAVGDADDAWEVWRGWLAERRLGLVPVAEPASFAWPARWIARLAGGRPVVLFGIPPGILLDPLGGGAGAIEAGWVLAPLAVPGSGSPFGDADPAAVGRVEAIVVAPDAAAPATRVDRVAAFAGRGLEGDRYLEGRGTFSGTGGNGRSVTLVEAEVLDEVGLDAVGARRNLVVSGIALNPLVGRRFTVGDVPCIGRRLCEPCAHLQRLTRPGVLRALVHRGGLRADLLADGEIAVGAEVRVVE